MSLEMQFHTQTHSNRNLRQNCFDMPYRQGKTPAVWASKAVDPHRHSNSQTGQKEFDQRHSRSVSLCQISILRSNSLPRPSQPFIEEIFDERCQPGSVVEIAGFPDGLGLGGVGVDDIGEAFHACPADHCQRDF